MEISPSEIISKNIERCLSWHLNPDNPALEAFSHSFEDSAQSLMRLISDNLPVSQPTFIVERTGAVGYMPPPEKRTIAAKDMRGDPYIAQRVYTEEVPASRSEKIADEVRFELFASINSSTHLTDQVNSLLFSISALNSLIASSNYLIKSQNNEPDIRVRRFKGDLLVVSDGAIGNQELKILPLNTQKEIGQAVAFCHSQLLNVLKFPAGAYPELRSVAKAKIGKQICGHLAGQSDKMVIPVLVGQGVYDLSKNNLFYPLFHFSGVLAAHPLIATGRSSYLRGFVPFKAIPPGTGYNSYRLDSIEVKSREDLARLRTENHEAVKAQGEQETPQEEFDE